MKLGADGRKAIEILTGAGHARSSTAGSNRKQLKATLATDAIIGALAAPSMPGTAYVLFHHVMGECDGVRGVWGYVRGGMGGLTQRDRRGRAGAGRRDQGTNAEVARILVKNGGAPGWRWRTATSIRATRACRSVDAAVTFLRLMDPKDLPAEFVESVDASRLRERQLQDQPGALGELPDFTCLPGHAPGPQHRGTIHICPDQDYIERAYDDAKYGYISEHPIIEATIPSALDDTVAPKGKHVMSMFTQYFPYKLAPSGTLEENKETLRRALLRHDEPVRAELHGGR